MLASKLFSIRSVIDQKIDSLLSYLIELLTIFWHVLERSTYGL